MRMNEYIIWKSFLYKTTKTEPYKIFLLDFCHKNGIFKSQSCSNRYTSFHLCIFYNNQI